MTQELSQTERERRAIESLLMLALPAEQQIAQFPSFVVVTDEIAELVEEAVRLLPDDPRFGPLRQIDQRFIDMGARGELWSLEALRGAPEWEIQRNLARAFLADLDIAERAPTIDWIKFIQ